MSKTSVPFIGFQPAIHHLPDLLKELDFRPFSKSVPEDFTTGDILHIFDSKNILFRTLIVRFTDAKHLYYSEHSGAKTYDSSYEAWMESSMILNTDRFWFKIINRT